MLAVGNAGVQGHSVSILSIEIDGFAQAAAGECLTNFELGA
jgi:hypothetical protein